MVELWTLDLKFWKGTMYTSCEFSKFPMIMFIPHIILVLNDWEHEFCNWYDITHKWLNFLNNCMLRIMVYVFNGVKVIHMCMLQMVWKDGKLMWYWWLASRVWRYPAEYDMWLIKMSLMHWFCEIGGYPKKARVKWLYAGNRVFWHGNLVPCCVVLSTWHYVILNWDYG